MHVLRNAPGIMVCVETIKGKPGLSPERNHGQTDLVITVVSSASSFLGTWMGVDLPSEMSSFRAHG